MNFSRCKPGLPPSLLKSHPKRQNLTLLKNILRKFEKVMPMDLCDPWAFRLQGELIDIQRNMNE